MTRDTTDTTLDPTKNTLITALAISSVLLAISAMLGFPHGSTVLLAVLVIAIVLLGALSYLGNDTPPDPPPSA